jgi:hypothetical protein
MQVVLGGKGGRSKKEGMSFIDHPFSHLGVEEIDARLVDQFAQGDARPVPVGGGADQDKRYLGGLQHLHRFIDDALVRARPPCGADLIGSGGGCLGGDVFGQLQVDGPGALLLRDSHRLPDEDGDAVSIDDLLCEFCDGPHHLDDVHDLKPALLAFLDRLLAGDHQDRQGAQLGVSGGGDQVGRARAQGGEAHARLAGQASVRGRHETRALLMPGQNEPNSGFS